VRLRRVARGEGRGASAVLAVTASDSLTLARRGAGGRSLRMGVWAWHVMGLVAELALAAAPSVGAGPAQSIWGHSSSFLLVVGTKVITRRLAVSLLS
jgi:TctA family transporter